MRPVLQGLLCGLLFGVGLVISGMSRPEKVIGFLDVFGSFDGSLAFVMAGAIGVHAPLSWLWRRRHRSNDASTDAAPQRRIDRRLIGGAVVFGAGWGAVGFCPAPAILGAGALSTSTLLFVASMGAGMIAVHVAQRR
jgi:uncharacterized protein